MIPSVVCQAEIHRRGGPLAGDGDFWERFQMLERMVTIYLFVYSVEDQACDYEIKYVIVKTDSSKLLL